MYLIISALISDRTHFPVVNLLKRQRSNITVQGGSPIKTVDNSTTRKSFWESVC